MKVAFLGTGLMGTPMVLNLAAAGHQLDIWMRLCLAKYQVTSEYRHPIHNNPLRQLELIRQLNVSTFMQLSKELDANMDICQSIQ